jgi:DNA polymerase-3 subunit delta'
VIIGHQHILDYFRAALKKDALSHAYGFVGPISVGKKFIANQIAAEFLQVDVAKIYSHPDYIYLERGEDEKTGKLKKVITIEQARSLKARLQNSTWGGGKRVVVIDDAELLNEESGNALLKLLEEPPKNTIFFLIIQNEAVLLSTIKSRLQLFYFSLVQRKVIEKSLVAMGIGTDLAATVARRSLGRPGVAIRFLVEENLRSYENLFGIFSQLSGSPFYKKIKLIEELYGEKEDGERGREAWQETLDQWIVWFRDSILKKHGVAEYAAEPGIFSAVNYTDKELLKIIEAFTRVKKMLKENVHPRLAIEEALLKIK